MRALSIGLLLLAACGNDAATPERAERGAGAETPPRPDPPPPEVEEEPEAPPREPALIAIDTHIDTTQRMVDGPDDVATRLEDGHVDLPRMREGGLTGAFFSIWVNPEDFNGEAAWQRALALIESVRRVAEQHPDVAVLCTTAEDVRRAAAEGKAALLMGVEGAHAIGTRNPERTLERLRRLYELGVRYMTITWSNDNPLGHSSGGAHPERGLTDLGRRVIAEMNRLGMIVDVSHVSDQTFSDIMDVTTKPVLASHSSARGLSDHPRNMTDDMIRRVGSAGGAVCVNYYSQFIDAEYAARRRALERRHAARFEAVRTEHTRYTERGRAEAALALELDPAISPPTLTTLGEHFERVVRVAGPSAACLGSDFDGVPELPVGMDDVADLPALRAELERRGLPLAPILGENVLRVLSPGP